MSIRELGSLPGRLLRWGVLSATFWVVATGLPLQPAESAQPYFNTARVDLEALAPTVEALPETPHAPEPPTAEVGTEPPIEAGTEPPAEALEAPPADAATAAQPDCVCPGWSRVADLPIDGQIVILHWQGDEHTAFEVRSENGEGWSDWVSLHNEPDEAPDGSAGGEGSQVDDEHVLGPVWVGEGTSRVEVFVEEGEPDGLELEVLESVEPAGGWGIEGAGAQPGVINRAQWGAGPWRSDNAGCGSGPSWASEIRFGVVHHTVTTNSYSATESDDLVRSVYYTHTNGNGWCDIGYNFLVDRFGQIFEGRSMSLYQPVTGGHAKGFNSGSTGVALLGQHHPGASPTASGVSGAAFNSVAEVLAWRFGTYGVNPYGSTLEISGGSTSIPAGVWVSLGTIVGHRNVGATGCPGDYAYNLLPSLRNAVSARIPNYPPPPPPPPPVPPDNPLAGDWDGSGGDTPGIRRASEYFLRNSNSSGVGDIDFIYGQPGDLAVVGDWDGDGRDTIGLKRGSTFYLRNSNTSGIADIEIIYGQPGDIPIVGDWDGDGRDTIGLKRGSMFYLRNSNTSGIADIEFGFGAVTDVPLSGDWDGDGRDGIGVRKDGAIFHLKNEPGAGVPDLDFNYGLASDVPFAGDWNDDGTDTVGVKRGPTWYLRNVNSAGLAEISFNYGLR